MSVHGGNELAAHRSVLIVRPGYEAQAEAIASLSERFFGEVLVDPATPPLGSEENRRVYLCGDLRGVSLGDETPLVIAELSLGHEALGTGVRRVRVGQVPISVHGLGVLFPELFDASDWFGRLTTQHAFQALTESDKPSAAARTGIYLSEVRRTEAGLRFHLLRCSSNLAGPTDSFRAADHAILRALRDAAAPLFDRAVDINHVLAQVYNNAALPSGKERKARIGAHADKTKDMHPDGILAFCSFYDAQALARLQVSKSDPYDRVHGSQSGLMRLHFKRKDDVDGQGGVPAFDVPLYPNSVLLVPLSTNRLYTHALRPSMLNADRAATRLGYVARCSAREAVFTDGRTHLVEGDRLVPLAPISVDGVRGLREDYRRENSSAEPIEYGALPFSMNAGDYLSPIE